MTSYAHIVPTLAEAIRLSDYPPSTFLLTPTKSAWKKAIKKKWVKVNGEIGTYGKFILGGENIELIIPDLPKPKRTLKLDLDVLYEDDYLALVHKRAGILVSGNSFFTIFNALEQNLQTSAEADAVKPLPIHRLDYPTTGVLLIGKTNSTIRELFKMFEEKEIQKTYYAITIGKMEKAGTIETLIEEKTALTKFEVIQTVVSERFTFLNLVKLTPKTGRRHQLRIHLAGMGNPILGDKEYALDGLLLNGKGLYLHAYSLQFTHPIFKKEIYVEDKKMERFFKIFPGWET